MIKNNDIKHNSRLVTHNHVPLPMQWDDQGRKLYEIDCLTEDLNPGLPLMNDDGLNENNVQCYECKGYNM